MLSSNQLQAILNHISDGIILVAPDGTINFANPRAESLLNLRQLHGKNLASLPPGQLGFTPESLDLLVQQLASGVWNQHSPVFSFQLPPPNSPLFVGMTYRSRMLVGCGC